MLDGATGSERRDDMTTIHESLENPITGKRGKLVRAAWQLSLIHI